MPLIPVRPHAVGIKRNLISNSEVIPYSKNTPPHFMDNVNKEKYLIKGRKKKTI